jgi:hypothetical protein
MPSAAAIVPTMMKNPSNPPGSWPAIKVKMMPTTVKAKSTSTAVRVDILPSMRETPSGRKPSAPFWLPMGRPRSSGRPSPEGRGRRPAKSSGSGPRRPAPSEFEGRP